MKKSKKTTPSDLQAADNIEDLKEKMLDMQMEIDILKETINVLKKDPGVDQTALRNTLAYFLVWCWEEHLKAKKLLGEKPETKAVSQ